MAASGPDRSYSAAERALWSSISFGAALDAAAKRRGRVVELMLVYIRRMGLVDDLLRLPVVHIAGTKGKGSTACMVEAMLRSAGLRTGMFTSPHLVSFRERFRLNGRPMAEDAFLGHFWHVWDGLHAVAPADGSDEDDTDVPPVPGFFHLLTLLALAAFSREKVDVLVLEVGLGGRLDATNVVPRPVVCGISRLDFDHVEVLGGTMAAIAAEKAGILKQACPAWTVQQCAEGAAVLARQAAAVGVPLAIVSPSDQLARGRCASTSPGQSAAEVPPLAIGPAGRFQRENAALAIALAETFLVRTGRSRAEDTCVPASMAGTWGPAGSDEVARVAAVTTGAAASASPPATPSGSTSDVAATLSLPRCPALPVAEALADGLAAAHWPGRAHTVVARTSRSQADPSKCSLEIVPGAIASDAASGDLVVLMDGAHTVASMREAAAWFVEASSAAAPPHSPPRARVLVFSCGQEKDAVQLMLPLQAVAWDAVVVCPMDSVRPSRHAAPSAVLLVDRFFERDSVAAATTCPGSDGPVHVMVSGSLYLVGDSLHAMGWSA